VPHQGKGRLARACGEGKIADTAVEHDAAALVSGGSDAAMAHLGVGTFPASPRNHDVAREAVYGDVAVHTGEELVALMPHLGGAAGTTASLQLDPGVAPDGD